MSSSNLTTRVTAAELKKMGSEFRTLAQKFNTHFETIRRLGNELDATWEGEARDAFKAQVEKETGKLAELYAVMTQYADNLEDAATKYTDTEKRNVNIVTQG